ncbi:SCO3242 family prenyltransferase [Kribbella sp. CA-293567]|uniref:SCO3242 family prenyltransferase n=1 Tax=Kribbella sp. CA-293567 TaxID=3002436 RepID=UPI0022DD316C|nr:UbiA family prenyltransferase [Kribbella sp. CA-293567]WBQ03088.1 UbiA family prenyltransferase [Kribbella sp. CA-293567]
MLKQPVRRTRLADLAELVRAPAALTVPGDVLAGAVAAGNLRPARLAGLAASSIAIYWAGMALNDWSDRDLDAVERPERPIPSGRVTPRTALALASGLTATGLALSALAGGRSTLRTSAVLAATAWTYDLAAKNTPAGPFVMATARALDVLVGAGSSRRSAVRPALAIGTHILTTTLISRGEVHGSTPAASRAALAATAAITTATAGHRRSSPATSTGNAAALAGLYAWSVGRAQVAAAQEPSAQNVRKAVGAGIHGLVPLQAAWCARGGKPLLGAGLTVALPLAKALARRISPT